MGRSPLGRTATALPSPGRLVWLASLGLLVTGCGLNPSPAELSEEDIEGSYCGTYTVVQAYTSDQPRSESGPVRLTIGQGIFRTAGRSRHLPPLGRGSVEIGEHLELKDHLGHGGTRTSELVVEGSFDYRLDADRLVLEQHDRSRDRLRRFDLVRKGQVPLP